MSPRTSTPPRTQLEMPAGFVSVPVFCVVVSTAAGAGAAAGGAAAGAGSTAPAAGPDGGPDGGVLLFASLEAVDAAAAAAAVASESFGFTTTVSVDFFVLTVVFLAFLLTIALRDDVCCDDCWELVTAGASAG